MNNRISRLKKNTVSSITLQVTTVICGFILPKLILNYYGSEINGLVSSIVQFLSFVSLLELGVGAVIQSNLYEPLAKQDYKSINNIMSSANKFFRTIGRILVVYVIILIIFYPTLISDDYSHLFTGMLIFSLSINSIAQYYIGVADRLFLTAAQLGYIQYNMQTFTLILNTFACYVLIKFGASIQTVKLVTSLIYLLRPLIIRMYLNRHYNINRNVKYNKEPIKQKWNGIAQHAAVVIIGQTDVIILTLFSTLQSVSIYSVYNLVFVGITSFVTSIFSGVESLLGELWAKDEKENLNKYYGFFEWTIHTITVLFFGCTMVLVVPFIRVYTKGIYDANYIQPLFAIILTIAKACICFKLPYVIMILVAGHYKQTQNNYIVAAILNIIISLILVKKYSLVGIAIGTLMALTYQLIWTAFYVSRHLMKTSLHRFWKQISVDGFISLIGWVLTFKLSLGNISYISWIIMGMKVFTIWLFVSGVVNGIFYNNNFKMILYKISKKLRRKVCL